MLPFRFPVFSRPPSSSCWLGGVQASSALPSVSPIKSHQDANASVPQRTPQNKSPGEIFLLWKSHLTKTIRSSCVAPVIKWDSWICSAQNSKYLLFLAMLEDKNVSDSPPHGNSINTAGGSWRPKEPNATKSNAVDPAPRWEPQSHHACVPLWLSRGFTADYCGYVSLRGFGITGQTPSHLAESFIQTNRTSRFTQFQENLNTKSSEKVVSKQNNLKIKVKKISDFTFIFHVFKCSGSRSESESEDQFQGHSVAANNHITTLPPPCSTSCFCFQCWVLLL